MSDQFDSKFGANNFQQSKYEDSSRYNQTPPQFIPTTLGLKKDQLSQFMVSQDSGVSLDRKSQDYIPVSQQKGSKIQRENYIQQTMKVSDNLSSKISPGLSPERLIKKFEKDYEDIAKFTLDEINRELDDNSNFINQIIFNIVNDIIILLNRRKSLIVNKRKKLKSDFYQKLEEIRRTSLQDLQNDIMRSSLDDQNLQNLVVNQSQALRMQRIVQSVSKDFNNNTQAKQKQEMARSQEFWNNNKGFEGDIDNLLKRLKYFDSELEKSNNEIQEMCRNLDQCEDTIKELLNSKTDDHLRMAEPMFEQKKKQHDQLKQLTTQRNKFKDEKINLIYKIIDYLANLQTLRGDRLRDLNNVFGIDEKAESSVKISYYIDFVDQLENLAKIKENIYNLEVNEIPLEQELDRIFKENDVIFGEMIKKQSEEAREFAEYQENIRKRLQLQKGVEYFVQNANLNSISHLDIKEILKKFKDSIIFLKPLVEEDVAIRQGLQKTNETISTFESILKANESEKERRVRLIQQIESTFHAKKENEKKTDEMRQIELEISKKIQQRQHLDDEMETIINDADVDSYKDMHNLVKIHESEINQLKMQKIKCQKEIDQVNHDVVIQMNKIKNEYDDIIREVLPSNFMNTYDFQKANDIKQVEHHLKKSFKRFGLAIDDSQAHHKHKGSNYNV